MPNSSSLLLLTTLFFVLAPTYTYAFGAGDIPDFAYLNDKAFRHGDIENILENLVKHAGNAAVGGGLIGFAKHVLKNASGGSKFSKSDVKKVYFGNWLRDYSQAMDIAGLSKLTADTLVLVVAVLGFMTFGYATEEFEVTADRLGVYLPVEHIDNPKGYAEKEGDAREYHPKLRPPVDERELEVDERTGMKKYMATEGEGWDTSTAFIRRTFQACIEHGRRAQGEEGADLWEAYRLLGQGLHTMEDLLAHSNWCEIALRKMGHEEVFCHVGDNVIVETPNGPAPPIVTGTFGGADFLHSLIGEAGDKLSQASVTDLSQKLDASQGENENNNISKLKAILSKLPIGGNQEKVNETEEIHEKAKAYNFNPDDVAPPEVQKQLLDILRWRDNVMRDIMAKIEMIPGLADLIEELTNAMNAYVYTILTPYLAPILKQTTGVLDEGSKAVINSEDQYEVFDNPNASDPSHSLLSKDHFGLILNEPAGKIAQVVVEYTVSNIVQAWANDSDADRVIDTILEAFHHPYYATGNSRIQHQMFEEMEKWLGGLGPDEAEKVIQALTKESIREHKNKRIGSEDQDWAEPGYGGCSHGAPKYNTPQATQSPGGPGHQGGSSGHKNSYGSSYDNSRNQSSGTYGESNDSYGSSNTYRSEDQRGSSKNYGSSNTDRYGSSNTYGQSQREDSYESGRTGGGYGRQSESEGYGKQTEESSGYQSYGRSEYTREERTESRYESSGYGGSERQGNYGSSRQESRYGRNDAEDSYGSSRQETRYGRDDVEDKYDRVRQSGSYGVQASYGNDEDSYGSGRRHHNEDNDSSHSSGFGNREEPHRAAQGYAPSYAQPEERSYGRGGYGERRDDSDRQESTYGSGYNQSSSGYAPSYGGGDDTFGAERMNIRDDNQNEGYGHHHGRKHHHRNNEDEY